MHFALWLARNDERNLSVVAMRSRTFSAFIGAISQTPPLGRFEPTSDTSREGLLLLTLAIVATILP